MQPADFPNKKVKNSFSLEICVDSIQSALAAEEGGADRVELCSGLSEGGLTPSAGLIEAVRKKTNLGLHVLIRPRRGDFLYSNLEFEIMKKDLRLAKEIGADGVVFGILKEDGTIDLERMQELVALSNPLSITFHRAFDLSPDPFQSLDALIKLKIHRLLTSGQQPSALQGAGLIGELMKRAKGKLIVMPGGGITSRNIQELMQKTGAVEFHSTARQKINSHMKFCSNKISMSGAALPTEYEHLVADPTEIVSLREIISGSGKN